MAKAERERGKKRRFRRPTIEEEIAIARIVEEKKEERDKEENLKL